MSFLRPLVLLAWLAVAVDALAAGTGLTGDYFTANNFAGTKTTRTDATVDFDWGAGSPGFGGLGTNNFSVRWAGQLEPRYSETYTFYVTADDGARLWVNDRPVAARTLFNTNSALFFGQIALTAGERVNVRVEFIETTGNARVRLEWASASQAREVVPQSQLYPTTIIPELGSILKEHWLNLAGTSISTLTSFSNYPAKPDGRDFLISFECLATNWTDNLGTRVSGYLVPATNGNYTFAVAASDRAELWLSTDTNPANRQLIATVTNATAFRDWTNQTNQISVPRALVGGGKYFIELLQKAGVGNDHWSVAWRDSTNASFAIIDAAFLVPNGLDRAIPGQTNFLDTLAQGHPRLFASAERFAWLKWQVTNNPTGQPAKWFTTIYNATTNLLTNTFIVFAPDNRGTILTEARAELDRIGKLGLVWRVTGDTNYAARAWQELTNAGALTNWNDSAHFLDTAEMTHTFALGYDWLYDYWTPTQRTFIRTNIETKGLNAGFTQFSNHVGWSQPTGNNWNLVCNGGLTMGALALGSDSEAKVEQMLNIGTTNVAWVMQHFTADNGLWYEGPGYWDYSTDYNFRHLAALESALGSDFGLSKIPGVDNAGLFAMLTTSAGKRSFNFADSGAGNTRGPQMFWWARRYLRTEYAYYQRTNAAPEPLDALLFDARGGDAVQEKVQPDFYFRGPTGTTIHLPQEVGVFRSGWNDTRETWLAFKGGEMGAPHGDLDAGSFVIEALGKRWAQDLGSDDYALPGYFSDNPAPGVDRWDYYRLRAEGNNCLVINPGSGPDTKLDQVATTLMFQSQTNGGRSLAVLDLTPVESNSVSRAWRGLQLMNGRNDVLVQDEIVASPAATAWWFMHVQTNTTGVAIDPDGKAVMLTQGAERLWLKILTTNGTFTLSNAVPLPTSPNPAGQNANSNYAKLTIKLTGVTNTTLAVLMKPLSTNQNLPLVLPTVVPLAQWLISPDDPPLALDGYYSTPENVFLDVDLTTLVTDLVTPGSNLIFGVSGATNGSVALQPDGHTARFTPATNYYGPAQFIYSVTNAATNASSAGVVVTVLPATWYWDTSTAAGLQAASGTWDGVSSNWSSASAGSSPLLAWPPQGNDAMFVGAGGSYTVTINATQKVNQITTTNGTWTFSGGALSHASGPLLITADADTTLNSPLVANTDFTKLGTNRLTLGAPVTFSGDVAVPTGTLRLATNGALPANVDAKIGSTNGTVGNLDVSANQTLGSINFQSLTTATNTVSIAAGNTLTISNAGPGIAFGVGNYGSAIGGITATTRVSFVSGGSLAINATNGTFSIEPSGTNNAGTALAVLDLSKLSNFTASVDTFSASVVAGKPNNVSGQFTLTLATNNTITAADVVLGSSGNGSGTVTISLGASNRINASNLVVAGGRYTGTMSFQAGTSSNLTLRGVSGGTSRANVFAGDQINLSGVGGGGGGSSTSTGTLNFGAATVDARINQLTLGIGASVASQTYGTGNGTFTFGGSNSVVDINQVYLGYATSNSTVGTTFNSPTHTGTLNMNGGALTVNSNFFLGYSADDNLGNTQKVTGVFNLSGGVANVASDIFLGYATNTVGTVTGTLNLTNGTLSVGGDILSSGVTATGAVNLVGAKLNLNGGNIGSALKPITLVTSNGTLQNLGELNAGATPLTKTGAGALTITGTNAFTGGTILSAGTLRLAGNLGSGVTATNGVFSGNGAITGSLVLGAPVSFQPQVNGTNAGVTYDQLVVSSNVTVGGALSPVSTNAGSITNGSTFTVIRNDGAAAVTNTFAGLPQLALLTNGPLVWRVNYLGGNGNDVDLTLVSGGASNTPPVLAAVSNRTLIAGQWLLITNTATDADVPAQTLTFSLPVAPTGAVMIATNGVLSWRPALAQAPSTNPFTVRVTDNGTPNLSATTNFLVTVLPVATPVVTTAIVQTNRFRLTVAGDTGPDYTVQATTNIPGWSNIYFTNSPVMPFNWTDTNASNFQRRFYRVVPGP